MLRKIKPIVCKHFFGGGGGGAVEGGYLAKSYLSFYDFPRVF